jgi:hypothetical protein
VSPNSALNLAEIAEKGLPTDSINYLKEKGLTFSEISEIVISPRTLKRRIERRNCSLWKKPAACCAPHESSPWRIRFLEITKKRLPGCGKSSVSTVEHL